MDFGEVELFPPELIAKRVWIGELLNDEVTDGITFVFKENIEDWCRDNLQGRVTRRVGKAHGIVGFESEQDMLLFKLTWVG